MVMARSSRFPLTFVLLALMLSMAHAADRTVRIGYQKYGNLLLLKEHGGLDDRLRPLGFGTEWTEFPSGPPLLEALRAGAIDFGQTGEAPPIFAQAGRASLLYVANEPRGSARRGHPGAEGQRHRVAGRAQGQARRAQQGFERSLPAGAGTGKSRARLRRQSPRSSWLRPTHGPAFESGSVDAWAIWDPYYAAAQAATGARTLATGEGIAPNVQFYLAAKLFAVTNPGVIEAIVAAVRDVDRWETEHPNEAAAELALALNLPAAVVVTALGRQSYGPAPLTPEVVAGQQAVADSFLALKLIPKKLDIADVVWKPGT